MGSTFWFYEEDWGPVAQHALDQVVSRVLSDGDYQRPWEASLQELESKIDEMEELSLDTVVPGWTSSIANVRAGGLPDTVDVARILAGESGLHSILDCPRIAINNEFGAISELSSAECLRTFGNVAPSSLTIRKVLSSAPSGRERGYGYFVVSYDDDQTPQSIFFFGETGD